MRKILLALVLALVSGTLYAQVQSRHMVSAALHGGANSMLEQTGTSLKGGFGPAGGVAIHYDYMQGNDQCMAGLRTGVGLSFSQSSLQGPFEHQFSRVDYLNNTLNYTVTGQVNAPSKGLAVTIPVMATLRAGGFYGALGAKAKWHSVSRANIGISDVHIDAYYPTYNVTVSDELITGRAIGEHILTPTGSTGWKGWDVAVAAEIGYEWRLTLGRYKYWQMGAMVYFDCSVWNQYTPTTGTNSQWVDVQPINDPSNPPAQVVFADAYDGQISTVHPMEIGAKLTFSWVYEDMRYKLPRRPRVHHSSMRYKPFKKVHRGR